MAQTALTLVGYAVGSYFGYPQLGAIVGAYVGGVVAAKDTQGPRINDTAVQQSSYGVGIPKTYGTDRISGVLIWAGPMVEHSDTSGGGLFGGPSVTTFSYTRSFAILLGDGPIGAIRRVWADTKLVADYRDLGDSAAQLASSIFESYTTLYLGDEAQLPDPTIESVEGAGNVEAYRGRAYIVFTDYPLAEFGNRIPQFSFEISPETATQDASTGYEPLVIYPWVESGGGAPPLHSVGDTLWNPNVPADTGSTSASFSDAIDLTTAAGATSGEFWQAGAAYSDTYTEIYTDSANSTYNREPSGANARADDAEFVYARIAAEKPAYFRFQMPTSSVAEDWLVLSVGVKSWVNFGVTSTGEVIAYRHPNYSVFDGAPPAISPAYQVSYASGSLPGSMAFLVRGNPVLQVRGTRVPTHLPRQCVPGDPCASSNGLGEMPGNEDFCISCAGDISPNYDWTIISGTAKQLCAIEYRAGQLYQNALGPVLLPSDPNYANAAYWDAQAAAAIDAGTMEADVSYPVVVSSYAQRSTAVAYQVAAGAADLAEIVLDICTEAGLAADQVDVSDLVGQEVLGYTRARRTSARSIIDPLRVAFFFDAVESGDVIRFVRRGGAPVATLTLDDLAAGPEEASADDPVLSDRGQEAELPRVVAIAYKSVAADYQTGTQQARRRVGGTEQQVGTELPLVLSDADAAQIAEKLLYDSWIERNKRTLSTWRKWSKLEPTDIIIVEDGSFSYRLRITGKSEQQGVLTLEAPDDDVAAYESVAVGAPVAGGGKDVRVDGPTRYELLDIPLLRAEDDSAAFYVAARGYRDDWRGGRLYRSTDNGVFYSPYQDLARVAIMGIAAEAIGDYAGGNTIDEINTLELTLSGGGELESITTAQLLGGGNPIALGNPDTGWEILQFKRAVLIGERTYRASGFLRGRLGTERYIGTHLPDERFVLLQLNTLYRPSFELSRLDVELLYKAVSLGASASFDGQPFTNTGVGLTPLAPVHLNVAPRPEGGYAATWVRRSRYPSPWADSVDAPLGETSESYRVRVLDGDTEVEAQIVTAAEATLGTPHVSDALSVVATYAKPVRDAATAAGGNVIGVLQIAAGQPVKVLAIDAFGAVVAESPSLGSGSVRAVAHSTDSIFLIVGDIPGASTWTLYRIAHADVTAIADSRSSPNTGDAGFDAVAFDGTDLWMHEYLGDHSDGSLLRLDPATLDTVDTYAATHFATTLQYVDGRLWIGNDSGGLDERDATTGATTGDTIDGFGYGQIGDLVDGDGLLFLVSGSVDATSAVAVIDATTLLQVGSPYTFPGMTPPPSLRWGAYIVVPNAPSGTHIFDATTGAHVSTLDAQAVIAAGARGSNLILTAETYFGSGVYLTTEYAPDAAISAQDYSGMTLEVCQVSSVIGAGFPATATIP